MVISPDVKTTLEFPEQLLRAAKATAAQQGQSLKQFVTDAVQQKLSRSGNQNGGDPPWMKFFGAAKGMKAAVREIDARHRGGV